MVSKDPNILKTPKEVQKRLNECLSHIKRIAGKDIYKFKSSDGEPSKMEKTHVRITSESQDGPMIITLQNFSSESPDRDKWNKLSALVKLHERLTKRLAEKNYPFKFSDIIENIDSEKSEQKVSAEVWTALKQHRTPKADGGGLIAWLKNLFRPAKARTHAWIEKSRGASFLDSDESKFKFLTECKAEIDRLEKPLTRLEKTINTSLDNKYIDWGNEKHAGSNLPTKSKSKILEYKTSQAYKINLLAALYEKVSEGLTNKTDVDLKKVYEDFAKENDVTIQDNVREHRSSGMFQSRGLTKTAAFLDKYHLLQQAPRPVSDALKKAGKEAESRYPKIS